MPTLSPKLELERCPHCSIDKPHLVRKDQFPTTNHKQQNLLVWGVYVCSRCGGVVVASSVGPDQATIDIYPKAVEINSAIPSPAKEYLEQAVNSLHAPAGAVMLAASSVDAMLKAKGYTKGTLNERIDLAAQKHLITDEMAQWAHEVRLDANEPRHADQKAPMPDEEEAKKAINFTKALAEFLFVLPSMVSRGLQQARKEQLTTQ